MHVAMMRFILLLSFFVIRINAWLPWDKGLFKNHEVNTTSTFTVQSSPINKRQIAPYKIRGVNLGSLFVVEPWMASNAWNRMGCGPYKSEFDCVMNLGQSAADAAFASHWSTWITQGDIQTMRSYGLNTIRIPVGYWIKEDIVYGDSEHFPKGGFSYLERLCGWASDAGMYIIIDLHGAPGAQVAQQPFTGQYAPSAGFYQTYQYQRAYNFLSWMIGLAHQNGNFRNVGMIEIVNEPIPNTSLINEYYPGALNAIRTVENNLRIPANNRVHIQMMDKRWGAGDPNTAISGDLWFAAYDDHRYIKYDGSIAPNRASYLAASCRDDVGGNWPVIVGEWSISPATAQEWSAEFNPNAADAKAWYTKWWAAQVRAYEKQDGWTFWSWKSDLGDWRWSYSAAVEAGVIPRDPGQAYNIGGC